MDERIQGEIAINEGTRAVRFSSPRLVPMAIGLVFLAAILWLAFNPLSRASDTPPFLGVLYDYASLLLMAAMWVCIFAYSKWLNASARRRSILGKRFEASFTVRPEGFVYETPATVLTVKWAAVARVIPMRNHWSVEAGMMRYLVPKRMFASIHEEKQFLASLLALASPQAREQSSDAMLFVG